MKLQHIISKINERVSPGVLGVIIALLAAVVLIPSAFAWGPDRATFSQKNPADYVTFNSITDNPKWGDERNFMRIRELADGTKFGDTAALQAGKKYEVIVLYHNNAKPSLNESGKGVATGAFARTEIPALVRSGNNDTKAMAYVGAANANPGSVYDHISFSNPSTADIALRYLPGSAKVASNGAINGQSIPDSLFSKNGTPIGYNALDGKLPGCDEFSGYITFTLVADAPGFTFSKDVRLAGTKEWHDSITANKGDKVEYRLSYKNTGTTEQKNVVMKDVLPKGLNYLAGQTDLINANSPNGKKLGDGINGDGVNIGHYTAGSNAFLYLFATVDAAPCTVLTNTAAVETANGNRQDTATVRVNGDCKTEECAPGVPAGDPRCTPAGPTALPTTGPAEMVAGLIGLAAITIGVVYYLKSRRELEETLHAAQSQPTTTGSDHSKKS